MTRENRLWRAVLAKACADAELLELGPEFSLKQRIRACRYLRGDTREDETALLLVCDFAELPSDRITLWARKRYPYAALVSRKRGPIPRKRKRSSRWQRPRKRENHEKGTVRELGSGETASRRERQGSEFFTNGQG